MGRKLPEGWKKGLKLKDIFEYQTKSKRKAGDGNENGDYKFITSSQEIKKFLNEADFQDGEYLVFGTGGSTSIHYLNESFSTSSDNYVVQINKSINLKESLMTKYVYYYLEANRKTFDDGFFGAGIKHISKEYINNISIIFPISLTEQQKIVDYLDEQFAQIDKVEQQLDNYENHLDQLEKGILEEAFGRSEKINIEKLVSTKYGINAGKETYGKYWLVRITDLNKEGFVTKDSQVFIDKKEDEIKDYRLNFGDLVLCRIGVDAGKIGIFNHTDNNAIHAGYLIKLNFNEKDYFNKFIWYYGKSSEYWNQVLQLMSGAAAPQFNAPAFKKLMFPKLDIQTQKLIAFKLDEQFKYIDASRQEIKKQKQNYKQLRKAMLNDIFGGYDEE